MIACEKVKLVVVKVMLRILDIVDDSISDALSPTAKAKYRVRRNKFRLR